MLATLPLQGREGTYRGTIEAGSRACGRYVQCFHFCCPLRSLRAATIAAADPVADFYRGKSINLILSAGAGGGYNQYAYAFAPFWSAHIPGNPRIVVQNMPGAGGIRAMIYFQSVAPQDGTALGFVHSSVPMAPLYGIKGAKFDPRDMHWLGSLNASPAICVLWHSSGIRTSKDVFEKEFSVGGTGAGSAMETIPAVLNRFFGTKIRIVSGYKGGNEIYLAMERGEVDGRCAGLVSSIRSTRPDWFPQNKVTVPIVIAFERNPLFPDAPAIAEFAKDEMSLQVLRLCAGAAGDGPAVPRAARRAGRAGRGAAQSLPCGLQRPRASAPRPSERVSKSTMSQAKPWPKC